MELKKNYIFVSVDAALSIATQKKRIQMVEIIDSSGHRLTRQCWLTNKYCLTTIEQWNKNAKDAWHQHSFVQKSFTHGQHTLVIFGTQWCILVMRVCLYRATGNWGIFEVKLSCMNATDTCSHTHMPTRARHHVTQKRGKETFDRAYVNLIVFALFSHSF